MKILIALECEVLIVHRFKQMFPYLFIIICSFYLVPFFANSTMLLVVTLVVILPLVCFSSSIFYALHHPFHFMFIGFIMLFFIPSVFIFYNETVVVFTAVYGVTSLVGAFIGSLIAKRK